MVVVVVDGVAVVVVIVVVVVLIFGGIRWLTVFVVPLSHHHFFPYGAAYIRPRNAKRASAPPKLKSPGPSWN